MSLNYDERVPVHIPGTQYAVAHWVWNPNNETLVLVEAPGARLMYGNHAVSAAIEVARASAQRMHDDLLARIGKPFVSRIDASGDPQASPILAVQQMIARLDRADRAMLRPWMLAKYDEDGDERPGLPRSP